MAFWYFPSNDHGENKGINDSGVATFRGTPLKSLAREICQNSLDAATGKTVRVDFSNYEIPTNSIPGAGVLKETFEKCLDYWNGQKAKTTKDFFKNAFEKIGAEKISVLRISDFKTKGLTGSKKTNDINTDWMRLTKSSGSSDMIDFSNPQIDRHIIRKFVSRIVPNGRNHFRWYMNLDGKDTTTFDMVTEGRKNNAVISFNDDEEDEPPLHIGDVIGLTELQQFFPNLLKNENQNGIISNVAKCSEKSSLDAILHRPLLKKASKVSKVFWYNPF